LGLGKGMEFVGTDSKAKSFQPPRMRWRVDLEPI
jgi:hypothetical protein